MDEKFSHPKNVMTYTEHFKFHFTCSFIFLKVHSNNSLFLSGYLQSYAQDTILITQKLF